MCGHTAEGQAPSGRVRVSSEASGRWTMPDGLYERDALAWAEKQLVLLRQMAAGELVTGAVDWARSEIQ